VEKSLSLSAICEAVRAADRGEAVIEQDLLARLLARISSSRRTTPARVNQRDRKLLAVMAAGRTDSEIAELGAVDLSSVQHRVAVLCARLGAHSRLEAVSLACRQGLLPLVDRHAIAPVEHEWAHAGS
jgi:DNA-binding NarL/FixJ family response regulator